MYNSETFDHSKFPDDKIIQLKKANMCYLLCEFMKSIPEVRKQDGSEYSPDHYYYLTLGIQKFLYEKGRNENIFADLEYDKFTDVLDEVFVSYREVHNDSSKYNFISQCCLFFIRSMSISIY